MKLFLLIALIFLSSYAPSKVPMASMMKETSIVTEIDTLANGKIKVHFMPVSTPKPLRIGELKVGDTITGLLLTKP